MIKISPSILSSDFSNLESECNKMIDAGADMLHIDVMDGQFVKNITVGPIVVKSIKSKIDCFLDVHLMIMDPIRYVEDFARAGAGLITFHIESCENALETIEKIRSFGLNVGLAISPRTEAESIFPFLNLIDVVLIMTVEPGFSGQTFIHDTMIKMVIIKEKIDSLNLEVVIEVDGGINLDTAVLAINSGAEILVSGSLLFNSNNPKRLIDEIKNLL